jgi:uncharacterized protein
VSDPHSPLRLNVGFIIYQTIGFSRDFPFEIPRVRLQDDLDITDLYGTVRVTRTPQGLLVQVKMRASASTECVRCLTDFAYDLNVDFSELYAFNQRSITDSNLILPEDGKIDLEPLLREYMLLEFPINPLCKPDCKGLCPICGENLNLNTCNHETENGDARLTGLQSLLDKQ